MCDVDRLCYESVESYNYQSVQTKESFYKYPNIEFKNT